MSTRLTVVGGASFDATVIPAGPLQPASVIPKGDLVDQYMATLTSLLFERQMLTEGEQAEIQQLVVARHALNQRASEVIEQFHARVRAKVTAEWETAKAEVRAQQQKIAEFHEQIAALTRELNKANEKKGLAFAARDSAQEEKRRLSRYADKRESEKANLLLAKRESEANSAAIEHGTIQQRINFLTLTELKPLQEKLNELMGVEVRLAHHVTGAGYTNELGLVIPARPPL